MYRPPIYRMVIYTNISPHDIFVNDVFIFQLTCEQFLILRYGFELILVIVLRYQIQGGNFL